MTWPTGWFQIIDGTGMRVQCIELARASKRLLASTT